MIVPAVIRQRFSSENNVVEEVAKLTREILLEFCERQGYAFTGRKKSLDSLAEKIESGRYRSWSDLDDRYACTIVVPTVADEGDVLVFLRRAFDISREDLRGTSQRDPQIFRFDATRVRAKLKTADSERQGDPLFQTLFEIQIRTAFEHAWSVTTHELVYKSRTVDWRRLHLAAEMKAAVEQLDHISAGFDALVAVVPESPWPETRAKVVIVDRMTALIDSGAIPEELAPKDWSRFAENVVAIGTRCARVSRANMPTFVENIMSTLEEEVRSLGPAGIPRSVSLFQFLFGVLRRSNTIGADLGGFVALVTDELQDLYPEVGASNPKFDFGITG